MSRSSYAVWRARLRPGRWPDAPQEEQACAVVVSAYRGLQDDAVDVVLDLPVYVEVDEEALEARRRCRLEATTTLCITPEVSEVVSDEPPSPPPRRSVSEAAGEPLQGATRAQIGLPEPEADDERLDTVTPLSDVEPPSPPPARRRDGVNNKEASSSGSWLSPSWSRPDLVLPPHERLSVSPTPTRLGAVILEEDEEEGGDEYGDEVDDDALSNAIYSDVIEDEDLYVSVPIEWDGSYASSNSEVWSSASGHGGRGERYDDEDDGSPEPEVAVSRPPRQPAQVIVIRASSNGLPTTDSEPSCGGGSPSRPPDDLPDERPVPRLAVRLLCPPCCLAGGGHVAEHAAGGADAKPPPPPSSPGNRLVAVALLLFALLVSLLLLNLSVLLRRQEQKSATTDYVDDTFTEVTTAMAP